MILTYVPRWKVHDAKLAENLLHQTLQLNRFLHHNREFYRMSKERAIEVVKEVQNIMIYAIDHIYKPTLGKGTYSEGS